MDLATCNWPAAVSRRRSMGTDQPAAIMLAMFTGILPAVDINDGPQVNSIVKRAA